MPYCCHCQFIRGGVVERSLSLSNHDGLDVSELSYESRLSSSSSSSPSTPGHKVARPDWHHVYNLYSYKKGASASPKDPSVFPSPQFLSKPATHPSSPPKKKSPPPPLKHATASGGSSTHGLSLLLHNLTDLHGRVEELGGAPVQAHGFALVELPLAVVGGDALLLARLLEAAHDATLALCR